MKTKFWMIWNPQGRAPVFQHPSLDSVRVEAARLARIQVGHEFIILEAVESRITHLPAPETILYLNQSNNEVSF